MWLLINGQLNETPGKASTGDDLIITIDLKKLAITVTGLLAWVSVVMIFISSVPITAFVTSLILFWLRGYLEDTFPSV